MSDIVFPDWAAASAFPKLDAQKESNIPACTGVYHVRDLYVL